MPDSIDLSSSNNADQGWDSYAERTLRNQGRLDGLEARFSETREADRKLIEQRSESLAQELVRSRDAVLELLTARSEALLTLSKEERASDQRALEVWKAEHEKLMLTFRETSQREGEKLTALLRESYDTAIQDTRDSLKEQLLTNYQQSREAIAALEQRSQAATARLEQMVNLRQQSDREARDIFAVEVHRRLENLNHNNERMAAFQANSVTRELWQAEKDATMARENALRDAITALDRNLLTMTPMAVSDKAHTEIVQRTENAIHAATVILDNKVSGLSEKVDELKAARDTSSGKSQGVAAFYAIAATVVTLIIAMAGLGITFSR